MINSILDGFKSFFNWIIEFVKEMLNALLMPLAEKIPDFSSFDFSPIATYIGFINSWIAFDWAIYLLCAYLLFIWNMILLKLFVKLFIPGEG